MSDYNNVRTCISCRKKGQKEDFVKVTMDKNGHVTVNEISFGRSAYICNSAKCIEKCIKNRLLNRAFKREVESKVYDKFGKTKS